MTALSLPQLSAAEDSIQLKLNAVREAKSMGHLRVTYNFSNNRKAKKTSLGAVRDQDQSTKIIIIFVHS